MSIGCIAMNENFFCDFKNYYYQINTKKVCHSLREV